MNLSLSHFTSAVLALSVSVLSVPSVMAQDSIPGVMLSLDDCVRIALDQSPTIKVADLEVERVDYSRKEVLGQLLPNVAFGATYNRMIAKQVAYMNMDAFDFGSLGGSSSGDETSEETESGSSSSSSKRDEGIKMGLDNSYQVGFNASVPLIAPQLWATLKLNNAQILQSVEQARASRLDLVNQVKNAYYSLLLAKDSRKTIRESYEMAKLTYEIYSRQHSVGAASEYDVLRASVAMKNVEPELVQADIAVKKARLQILILMGASVDAPFDFLGELADYEKTMYSDVLSLGTDYSMNTSLVQNELQTNTLEQALKVQERAWLPTLSLIANYNWTSSSQGNPLRNFRWNPYSVVGLSLNFPIFQGGQRLWRVRQARLQVAQSRLRRQDLEHSVAMQADLARDNITLNVKQIASCSESVSEAERAHDIMQKSFDIGASSYLDLRDSELALTRSRLAYYQAIYNYLVAGASLELILGNAVPM